MLLGVALSFLTMTFVSARTSRRKGVVSGLALATLVAVGIGLHNLGEGLAIGTSFGVGELTLGTFLIVGFMIHNITEGLGIAAPLAEEGEAARIPLPTLVGLAADRRRARRSSAPGSAATRAATCWRCVFFAAAAGAALQVVVEVDALRRPPRARRAHVGLRGRRLPRRARGDVRDRAARCA